ncbi:MAG: hypothetical protein GXP54_12745 [Deltaproteobacteria bacterium]|nr:hypothetical protein [Deltaproteobacteria bacterium]
MGGNRGYKRRKIWINASFQTRYTAMIVGVAMSILVVLGFMYMNTLGEQQRIMGVNQAQQDVGRPLDQDDREFNKDLGEEVGTDNLARALTLAMVAAVLVALLAWVSVRMTFRAAGPVFAVSMMLRAMAQGRFNSIRKLRSKDEFRFLEADVFSLRDSMIGEAQHDRELYARAVEALRSVGSQSPKDQGDLDGLIADLERALKSKEEKTA